MKNRIFIVGAMIFWLFFGGKTVWAAAESFTVKTVMPENQLDQEKTYFDLRVTPNTTQDLEIILQNNSSEKKTIAITANSATTNDHGVVEYSETGQKPDASLKINLKDILKIEKEVVLEANTEKKISAHLAVPAEPFDGILLGGLTFSEKPAGNQALVENQYAYCVGIVLSENDQLVEPELKLTQVRAGQANYRNSIKAHIQNDKPAMIKTLNLKGAIYQKGHKKPLYTANKQELKMAPNSSFDFNILLNDQPLKAGSYLFKGQAAAEGKTWHFEKDFEIAASQAKKLNAQAVEIEQIEHRPWTYLIIGIIILLGITLSVYFVYLR